MKHTTSSCTDVEASSVAAAVRHRTEYEKTTCGERKKRSYSTVRAAPLPPRPAPVFNELSTADLLVWARGIVAAIASTALPLLAEATATVVAAAVRRDVKIISGAATATATTGTAATVR